MQTGRLFIDRIEAGRRLAEELEYLRDEDLVVLGLPRGGVPVAAEVAEHLDAPLDVIVVRKLGVPFQPELGMGAIGEDGVRIVNREVMAIARLSDAEMVAVEQHERAELDRQARRFRSGHPRAAVTGRTALIIDDGVATGSTARAACQVARAHGASRVILAVPVAPFGWADRIGGDADETIALSTPEGFQAVGQWYEDFHAVPDHEVVACLSRFWRVATNTGGRHGRVRANIDREVSIPVRSVLLQGHLRIPAGAHGIVVFVHGSGSSRHSPRNQFVAGVLNEAGLGTLLFDLLTRVEEADRSNVFDIDLLSERLVEVTRWLRSLPEVTGLRIAFFGASTGAAAALWAASEPDMHIAAIVSRGGRPDLAEDRLGEVHVPTRLIVGSDDHVVLRLNQRAHDLLGGPAELVTVAGATHLFEEPGTLQAAAELARECFLEHLSGRIAGDEGLGSGRVSDPYLARAREDAEGVTAYGDDYNEGVALVQREEAEGVDLFEDPDHVLSAAAVRQGSPGHETLVGDDIGQPDIGEDRRSED